MKTTIQHTIATLTLSLLMVWGTAPGVYGQVTYEGNQQGSFGGPVGESSMVWDDDGETITIEFNVGGGDFNDAMVIYLFTGQEGRNVIDNDVNDQGDDLRRAISSAGEDASVITFPEGFEASHAIAIDAGFGGLWAIPESGSVVDNELHFVTSVESTLSDPGDANFSFEFDYDDLGITSSDDIGFVATYLNAENGFHSNEGYGDGLPGSNVGGDSINFTSYWEYPSGNKIIPGLAPTTQGGNWDDNATWVNNEPPGEDDIVEINHDVTLNINSTIGGITIEAGHTLTSEGVTLTVQSSGSFNADGTFDSGNGKVVFTGGNTVSGNATFNDVDLQGGVDFGSDSELTGEMRILAGGFVNSNPPSYEEGSTLTYNNDGDFGVGDEWPVDEASSPWNLRTVDTEVNFGDTGDARTIRGNLTIEEDGELALSTSFGGDLRLLGDWTNAGTFSSNDRAVFFVGGEDQNIENTSPEELLEIPFVIIDKDDNEDRVTLLSDMVINNLVDLQQGILDVNGNKLVLESTGVDRSPRIVGNEGEIVGDFTVQRYIADAETEDEDGQFHFLTSPFEIPFKDGNNENALLSNTWVQAQTGGDNQSEGAQSSVFTFNEAAELTQENNLTEGWETVEDVTQNTVRGKGYLVFLFDKDDFEDQAPNWPKTLEVTGGFNANEIDGSDIPLPVSYFGAEENDELSGWNLVGNPFVGPINWDTNDGWTRTNLDNTYQLWNSATGEYEGYNHDTNIGFNGGSQYIAPFQAFWVKANDDNPELNINSDAKTGESATFLKQNSNEVPKIALRLSNDTNADELVLTFREDGSTDELGPNDAAQLSPFSSNSITLAAEKAGSRLTLMHLPEINDEFSFDLHLGLQENAAAELSIDRLRAWDDHWTVVIRNGSEETNLSEEGKMEVYEGNDYTLILSNDNAVSGETEADLPSELALKQNYPNPFNPTTMISYDVPEQQHVRLTVYDMLGRQVSVLVDETQSPGSHDVTWDASQLSSGVYIYRLEAGGQTLTRKMTLVK